MEENKKVLNVGIKGEEDIKDVINFVEEELRVDVECEDDDNFATASFWYRKDLKHGMINKWELCVESGRRDSELEGELEVRYTYENCKGNIDKEDVKKVIEEYLKDLTKDYMERHSKVTQWIHNFYDELERNEGEFRRRGLTLMSTEDIRG